MPVCFIIRIIFYFPNFSKMQGIEKRARIKTQSLGLADEVLENIRDEE